MIISIITICEHFGSLDYLSPTMIDVIYMIIRLLEADIPIS